MLRVYPLILFAVTISATVLSGQERKALYKGNLSIDPPTITTDKSVKYDYRHRLCAGAAPRKR